MTETDQSPTADDPIVAEEAYLNAVRDVLAFQKMEAELAQTRSSMIGTARRAVELFGSDPMGVLDRLEPAARTTMAEPAQPRAAEPAERRTRKHVNDQEFEAWVMEQTGQVTVQQVMDQFGIAQATAYRRMETMCDRALAVRTTELHQCSTPQHTYRINRPAPNGPTDPKLLQPARSSQPAVPVAGTGRRERWSSVSEINELLWALPRDEAIIQRTGMDHISVQNRRTGKKVTMSQTPRSTNTQKIKADLRAIGFSIDS